MVGCVEDRFDQGGPDDHTVSAAAWAALEMPMPTQMGSLVVVLTRRTKEPAASPTDSVPVTPISEEA